MASTISYEDYPYVVWKIQGLPTVQQLNSEFFFYVGNRFSLSIQQEVSVDVHNYYFAMYLEEWGNWVERGNSFKITVCLRDNEGENCFIQTREVTDTRLETRVRVWNVRRSDLLSKYSDFSTDNTVTFICVLGPYETNGIHGKWNIRKEHKSVQVSLDVNERCLNALLDDYLRLFEESQQVDVLLKCQDGTRFSAHKTILCARSEVFAAMFRNPMSERESGEIAINDISPSILFHFLRYLYSGRLDCLTGNTASLLYAVGDKYAVDGLKERCVDFIVQNLSKNNVFDFVRLASIHSDAKFRKAIVSFVAENDSLLKETAWLDFWRNEPTLAFKLYEDYVEKCSSQKD